eukprot:2023090-Pyramimonas_sp.AAC.1
MTAGVDRSPTEEDHIRPRQLLAWQDYPKRQREPECLAVFKGGGQALPGRSVHADPGPGPARPGSVDARRK